jgi:hypothetical protein
MMSQRVKEAMELWRWCLKKLMQIKRTNRRNKSLKNNQELNTLLRRLKYLRAWRIKNFRKHTWKKRHLMKTQAGPIAQQQSLKVIHILNCLQHLIRKREEWKSLKLLLLFMQLSTSHLIKVDQPLKD